MVAQVLVITDTSVFLSRRATLNPFSERILAVIHPAGPAPTITTSYLFMIQHLRFKSYSLKTFLGHLQ
jgi:hypothetical protein